MAKFKPVRPKTKDKPVPQGAVPCVILVISAILFVMFLLYYVLKNANG